MGHTNQYVVLKDAVRNKKFFTQMLSKQYIQTQADFPVGGVLSNSELPFSQDPINVKRWSKSCGCKKKKREITAEHVSEMSAFKLNYEINLIQLI